MLSEAQQEIVEDIQKNFVDKFSTITFPSDQEGYQFEARDAFVGYHNDMVSTLVFHVCNMLECNERDDIWKNQVKDRVRKLLLQSATPEAIFRLPHSNLASDYGRLFDTYFKKQQHESLKQYLRTKLRIARRDDEEILVQVTTHSKLLVHEEKTVLAEALGIPSSCLEVMFLKSFQTQQQCREEIRRFYLENESNERLLLVQCEDGNRNTQLIACASYCILEEKAQVDRDRLDVPTQPAHVVFVINLARMMGDKFASFPGGPWECVHIDDVRPARHNRPEICSLMGADMPTLLSRPGMDTTTNTLLRDAMHMAASRIEDAPKAQSRTTERIEIIHSLMNQENKDPKKGPQEEDGGGQGGATAKITEAVEYEGTGGISVRYSGEAEVGGDGESEGRRTVRGTGEGGSGERAGGDGREGGGRRGGIGPQYEDEDAPLDTPLIQIEGNNNIVIQQGANSTTNIELRTDVDIIDQITERVMTDVTDRVVRQLTSLTSSMQHDENTRLRSQNQALITQNRMLWQVWQTTATHGGQLCRVKEGSITLVVRFDIAANLDRFWQSYHSGQLARDLAKCLITDKMETRTGCSLDVRLNILESDYRTGMSVLETFTSVTKRRVSELLKEREEFSGGSRQSTEWLSHKALAMSRIQESGTFRRSLWQQLLTTTSPLLAETFAFYDYNDNLSILKENHNRNAWKHKLWLGLANPKTSPLHFSDFLPPEDKSQETGFGLMTKSSSSSLQILNRCREKAPVKMFGSGGRAFTATIPFSWLIMDSMNRLYTVASEQRATRKNTLLHIFTNAVGRSDLGKILQHTITPDNYAEFMDGYIHDFVRMSYETTTQSDEVTFEFKCVEESLKAFLETTSRQLNLPLADDVLKGLVYLHTTYHQCIKTRLQQFSDLVQACPTLLMEEHHASLLTHGEEMILDVKAIEILVEKYLVPSKDEMTKPEHQRAWLEKVQNVKVLIENCISSVNVNGTESQKIIKKVRPAWNRIRVLELFYEHVCVNATIVDERVAPQGRTVWNSFYGGANFKNVEIVRRLKTVLNKTTEFAAKLDFQFGIHESCGICNPNASQDIEDPVVLPCNHIFCEKCIQPWFRDGRNTCPKCVQEVPADFNATSKPETRKLQEKFQIFKRNRNTFFFEIVSQLCFADNTPPNDDVIYGLLKYVTAENYKSPSSEQEVLFDADTINPDFTLRSVILQLLIQSCEDKVNQFIDSFLRDHASSVYSSEDVVAVCLMYMYTIESSFLAEESQVRMNYENSLQGAIEKLQKATERLTVKSTDTSYLGVGVSMLRSIAKARYGLIVTAHFLYLLSTNKLKKTETANELFKEAQKFCIESICKQEAHLFLLKHLCHSYGTEALQHLSYDPNLTWILTDDLKGRVQRISDGFVVTGAVYTNIRDALYQSVVIQEVGPFVDAVKDLQCPNNVEETAVLLAIFREVTLSNAAQNPRNKASEQIKDGLLRVIRDGPYRNKELALRLIQNRLCGGDSTHLVIAFKQSYDHQMIAAFVIHALIVFHCCPDDFLRKPLKTLLEQPKRMRESPLIVRYLADAYKYHLPKRRASEGEIDPIGSTIFRMIVWSILLGSAFNDQRSIRVLVPPDITGQVGVTAYLWKAISTDLKCIQTLANQTDEHCLSLCHMVLERILTTSPQERETSLRLSARHSRDPTWHHQFVTTFISCITSNVKQVCLRAETKLNADKKDVVMQVLHKPESLDTLTSEDIKRLPTLPTVWQFHPLISVNSVQQYLEAEGNKSIHQYTLLQAFLQQELVLRAMVYLPDIIRLQRLLFERFHRCIDAVEAEKFSPDMYWEAGGSNNSDDEILRLMERFILAWNNVIDIGADNIPVPERYKHHIAIKTCNLAVFLPTSTGEGQCSKELVNFLIDRHNDFMDLYHDIKNLKPRRPIPPERVAISHLIAFDENKDLLPLIQAHCYHNLKESVVTFNLDNLERAVEDHYIRGRPLINKEVDEVIFREGALNSRVFQVIRDKVPQDSLSLALKQDILSELKSITELCDCLAVTEIVIGFLATTGGDPDVSIIDYLEKDLNLPKEQQQQINPKSHHCRLRHTLALWQLLAVERAKRRLASQKQDPFEGIDTDLKANLTDKEKEKWKTVLRFVDVEQFTTELYEFIELDLRNIRAKSEDIKQERLMKRFESYLEKKKHTLNGFDKLKKHMGLSYHKAVDAWRIAVQGKH